MVDECRHHRRADMRDILSWAAQQCGVPLFALAWAIVTPSLLQHATEGLMGSKLRIIQSIWELVGVGGVGFGLGLAAQRLYPTFARSGKWIWILPMVTVCFMFWQDLREFPLHQVVSEFLGIWSSGESGLAGVLFTFPAWSSLSYSLAIYLAEIVWRKPGSRRNSQARDGNACA